MHTPVHVLTLRRKGGSHQREISSSSRIQNSRSYYQLRGGVRFNGIGIRYCSLQEHWILYPKPFEPLIPDAGHGCRRPHIHAYLSLSRSENADNATQTCSVDNLRMPICPPLLLPVLPEGTDPCKLPRQTLTIARNESWETRSTIITCQVKLEPLSNMSVPIPCPQNPILKTQTSRGK